MKVILASASPRRQALLQQIGIEPVVQPASFEEVGGRAELAHEVALANAKGKCDAVYAETGDELPAMLTRLSGRTHQVMTGVAVRYKGQQLAKVCTTDVSFRELTAAEIAAYIATKEPLDKAGAYGIQGRGAVLVEKINGCYNNVVGLPLTMLHEMFRQLGV